MESPDQDLAARAQRIVQQRLESLRRAGVQQLPKAKQRAVAVQAEPVKTTVAETRPIAAAAPAPSSAPVHSAPVHMEESMPRAKAPVATQPKTTADRQAALDIIRCEVEKCVLCPALVKNRTQTVFGVGNPKARVCFFGEAPGADEDRQGEPFVGKAGQLLNKIIEACTFQRSDVYILNVLKCRPPDNRPPEDSEAANCRQYFTRQLEIIRPEYIVCLGASSAKALLQSPLSIGKLRGSFHTFGEAKVLATYHPAYLLRNPAAKADVWEDMKLLLKDMGIELPKKSG